VSPQELPATIARPVAKTVAAETEERNDASPLPTIMANDHTLGTAEWVSKFCLSPREIFEA